MSFVDVLKLFKDDPQTEGIVMVGEIMAAPEEEGAEYIKANIKKPVVATSPASPRPRQAHGHAGAIIMGGKGTAADKFAALEAAGAKIVRSPADIGAAMKTYFRLTQSGVTVRWN